nr:putative reverse transcriptase domain-containing protein [Tanacetum cinerariifolium]
MHDGFLFKGNQLCIPDSSLRLKIIKELHGEGHVGHDRTLQLVQASYFWPTMRKEVDRFSKMVQFIPCKKTTDAVNMVNTQLNFSSAYHPQTDGKTEVVNRSSGNLLSTGFSPFQVVYSAQPHGPLDLMTLQVSSSVPKKVKNFVAGLPDVHKAVRDNLVRANSKYKQDADQKRRHVDFEVAVRDNLVRANSKYKQDADQKRRHVDFEVGNFVCVVLTKDCFPVGDYNKLSAKKIGPLEIVEKMNSNAYRLKLPSHIRCSDVFNVKNLFPYHGNSSDEDSVGNSRMSFVYPGGNDVNPSIEEQADLFLEAQDRVRKKMVY